MQGRSFDYAQDTGRPYELLIRQFDRDFDLPF
jgi:hypothetical protein